MLLPIAPPVTRQSSTQWVVSSYSIRTQAVLKYAGGGTIGRTKWVLDVYYSGTERVKRRAGAAAAAAARAGRGREAAALERVLESWNTLEQLGGGAAAAAANRRGGGARGRLLGWRGLGQAGGRAAGLHGDDERDHARARVGTEGLPRAHLGGEIQKGGLAFK